MTTDNTHAGPWALDAVRPSLSGTGTALYLCAQVRSLGDGRLRFQSAVIGEHTYFAGPDVKGWVESAPAPHASLAGTSKTYAECYIRPSLNPPGLRVQMAGVTGGNRGTWAEWLHAGVDLPKVAGAILAATNPQPTDDADALPVQGGVALPAETPEPDDDEKEEEDA